MKYGLGQRDLNLKARLALRGMSDTIERDIVELLRSGQPIEQETRERLADALEGKQGAVKLVRKGTAGVTPLRRFRLRRSWLQVGKQIEARAERIGAARAIEEVAQELGGKIKNLEKMRTFARRAAAFVSAKRESGEAHGVSDAALEIRFVWSEVFANDAGKAVYADTQAEGDFWLEFERSVGP